MNKKHNSQITALKLILSLSNTATDTYYPSEELVVKLSPKIFQAAFEVRGAIFLNGKCGGHRVVGQSGTIKFPSESEQVLNVSIHSAWAKSYSSGVKLAVPFILFPLKVAVSTGSLNEHLIEL